MTHKLTSNQPEPAKTRIYGSTPVAPLGGPSDQPAVVAGTTVYGQRQTPTVRVRLRRTDDERELVIAESEFDPDRHELVD